MSDNWIHSTWIGAIVLGLALITVDGNTQGRKQGTIRVIGGNQANYTDTNHDGVCDNIDDRQGRGRTRSCGAGFVDADGDGVCDHQAAGKGRGFVDADSDGINDNSPLAQLNLTDEQKAQIVALRESVPGPHRDQIQSILTEEQLEQLQAIRAERQADCPRTGNGPRGKGRGFVDADGDGINDNSPLAQLNLTDEQKAQIAALRESTTGPLRDQIQSILTEEQLEQLQAIRAERQASGQGRQAGPMGPGSGHGHRNHAN